ncbi:hypothetical protein LCGC14_1584150 [marine sediment metagenome]|uniref:Uncharacterized protein n=1 Tax=marine sediment metagenome TaxID=412755 RepID=A0A0F9KWJ2_9ZZZZ
MVRKFGVLPRQQRTPQQVVIAFNVKGAADVKRVTGKVDLGIARGLGRKKR